MVAIPSDRFCDWSDLDYGSDLGYGILGMADQAVHSEIRRLETLPHCASAVSRADLRAVRLQWHVVDHRSDHRTSRQSDLLDLDQRICKKAMNIRILSTNSLDDVKREISAIGSTPYGIKVMSPKGIHRLVKVEGVRSMAANIMKQEMLASGGEVALAHNVVTLETETTTALIMGTLRQFDRFLEKLKLQPFGLKDAAQMIEMSLVNYDSKGVRVMDCAGKKLNFGKRTLIMGVLNVTPDSFSDGGRYDTVDLALAHADKMIAEGVDIVDIGGESSRPGADAIGVEAEKRRVLPIIEELAKRHELRISIDTYKPAVAREAMNSGASIINDITAFAEPDMIQVAAETNAGVVLMHMKGTPKIMQLEPHYDSLISEIYNFLEERIEKAVEGGVSPKRLMVDPGIGFGKKYEHNLEILRRLKEFRSLDKPILIGTSRKSFIGMTLDLPVEERLEGTAATIAVAIINGADIVRVHDVKEMKRVAKMTDAICR